MTYGDGHVLSVDYDQNYRATNLRRAKNGLSLINMDFTYDPASDITAINDNARPERSQAFGYDALSRLTSADGAYGSIDYGYNAGGDRTFRDWSKTDGTLQSERYTYEAATARLLGVALDDGAGNLSPLRDFTYNASGQVTGDTRTSGASANIYSYGINARGRMTSVSLGGTQIASYTYDAGEQRIVKVAANQTTHYHYDLEGRLIAETDGATGETLREYVWLGLMPIAVIAPDPGSGSGTSPGECNPALIEALEAELATATAAADALQSQILDWDGNIAFREAKIAEMRAQLETLSGKKREKLEDKITRWEAMITSTEAKVDEAETELAAINTQIADIDTALAEQQAICDGTTPILGTGTFYLHALASAGAFSAYIRSPGSNIFASRNRLQSLGRPQFATDSDGVVVWDMGDQVTPFGQGVNLAGAFAQKLMFPGQYADEETGEEIVLSHNWHRTGACPGLRAGDPTLGRYLQSDPIGLAGGLNRYAYAAGSPVRYVDPDGRVFYLGVDGYMPQSVDMAANLAEAISMKDKPLCEKLIWWYKTVNYGARWDYKATKVPDHEWSGHDTPAFENFGNWHYGVMGAAAGIPGYMLTNGAGAAQIKNGTAILSFPSENARQCEGARCLLGGIGPVFPANWDDPKDQYWIRKGINDYKNNEFQVIDAENLGKTFF